jgi:tellurite resistance protein TerC
MIAWAVFFIVVLGLLVLDLKLFHRKDVACSLRQAAWWSVFWVSLALAFNAFVYLHRSEEEALQFFTGYLLEKSLSLDNIFVMLVIFSYFKIDERFQHRVLYWGILGALVMRMVFIFAGVALIEQFSWMIYLLGAFLVYSGGQLVLIKEQELRPEKNFLVRLLYRLFPIAAGDESGRFFVRKRGKWMATRLAVVLMAIEGTDVLFALDSIPAIFAITTDRFVVYTSNIFAMLGLRSLYFVLAGFMNRLYYLRHGLGLILVFVGVKMLISHFYPIPIVVSLSVIAVTLAVSLLLSMRREG